MSCTAANFFVITLFTALGNYNGADRDQCEAERYLDACTRKQPRPYLSPPPPTEGGLSLPTKSRATRLSV